MEVRSATVEGVAVAVRRGGPVAQEARARCWSPKARPWVTLAHPALYYLFMLNGLREGGCTECRARGERFDRYGALPGLLAADRVHFTP